MDCPRGHGPLTRVVRDTLYDRVELDVCPKCHGVWFDRGELAAVTGVPNPEAFAVDSPLLKGATPSLPCPRNPRVRMVERKLSVKTAEDLGALALEQCAECGGVWLDGGNLDKLAAALRDRKVGPFLEDPETKNLGSVPLWLFMFFTGLPIEQWNPRSRRPVVTTLLVLACAVAFLWQIRDGALSLQRSVLDYGLVPAALLSGQAPAWTLVSSMFLHGGVAHLLGNMYFLWVFGDNVEDRIGRFRYLLLYLLAGVAAALAQVALEPDKSLPVVGASGAISGVMAAYAVLFPRTRLISLIFFFRVRWRAAVYLFGWLGFQILGALIGTGGIAWWAHIGGFFVGALMARRFRPPLPTATSSILR